MEDDVADFFFYFCKIQIIIVLLVSSPGNNDIVWPMRNGILLNIQQRQQHKRRYLTINTLTTSAISQRSTENFTKLKKSQTYNKGKEDEDDENRNLKFNEGLSMFFFSFYQWLCKVQ